MIELPTVPEAPPAPEPGQRWSGGGGVVQVLAVDEVRVTLAAPACRRYRVTLRSFKRWTRNATLLPPA